MQMVNQSVECALKALGYDDSERESLMEYLLEHGNFEGSSLLEEHLPVFDCAMATGGRSIEPMGHIKMLAAVQPYISQAVSKTINLSSHVTSSTIYSLYSEAYKLGLKSIALYRDGCKRIQPLGAFSGAGPAEEKPAIFGWLDELTQEEKQGGKIRERLPDDRPAIIHKFDIAGHDGYIHVGFYSDGRPGELFINLAKQGSTLAGLMDSFATSISLGLQYGIPLEILIRKFAHVRFEPSGYTQNPRIPLAKSVIDYIFRWLASQFLAPEVAEELGVKPPKDKEVVEAETQEDLELPWVVEPTKKSISSDSGSCSTCGGLLIRTGACMTCSQCGLSGGCG
jgi:ribonucleoside-diphosphate reductase alpha chain